MYVWMDVCMYELYLAVYHRCVGFWFGGTLQQYNLGVSNRPGRYGFRSFVV